MSFKDKVSKTVSFLLTVLFLASATIAFLFLVVALAVSIFV